MSLGVIFHVKACAVVIVVSLLLVFPSLLLNIVDVQLFHQCILVKHFEKEARADVDEKQDSPRKSSCYGDGLKDGKSISYSGFRLGVKHDS